MASCFSPLKGYRGRNGFHSKKHGSWEMPLNVPCGACLGCRLNKAADWSTRIAHEASLHEQNTWVTLTYDPEHLPEGGTLVKKHVQYFMTYLRRYTGSHGIRYFAVGEYGSESKRPHYHITLFNFDFKDKVHLKNTFQGHPLYTSELLTRCWPKGHSFIGELNIKTAKYTAEYVMKQVKGANAKDYYRTWYDDGSYKEIIPPFALSSRMPGLGHDFYQKHKAEMYRDLEVYIPEVGKAPRIPAYYDWLLAKEDPELWEDVKRRRQEKFKLENPEPITDHMLQQRFYSLRDRTKIKLKREHFDEN